MDFRVEIILKLLFLWFYKSQIKNLAIFANKYKTLVLKLNS